MTIKSFTFGPFQTNTYVVSVDERVFLIDPACFTEYDRQTLVNYINSLIVQRSNSAAVLQHSGLSILATHGHLDHLWGAAWACRQFHTEVCMHEADFPLVETIQEQYDLFGIPAKPEPFPIKPLNDISSIVHCPLSIIHTPGHTSGSVCLYWPDEKVLLSGDTLFCMGFGRTDLPSGNYGQLIQSISILFDLPDDVRVYPGHGSTTTIGAEKRGY